MPSCMRGVSSDRSQFAIPTPSRMIPHSPRSQRSLCRPQLARQLQPAPNFSAENSCGKAASRHRPAALASPGLHLPPSSSAAVSMARSSKRRGPGRRSRSAGTPLRRLHAARSSPWMTPCLPAAPDRMAAHGGKGESRACLCARLAPLHSPLRLPAAASPRQWPRRPS